MHRTIIRSYVLALLGVSISATAVLAAPTVATMDQLAAFAKYKMVSNLPIKVPTVVEMSISDLPDYEWSVAVVEMASWSVQPSYLLTRRTQRTVPLTASSSTAQPGTISAVNDGLAATYASFLVPQAGVGVADIALTAAKPITSSSLQLTLDANVALPTSIELYAYTNDGRVTVIANRSLSSTTVYFPSTTSQTWELRLYYTQPLRIAELAVVQDSAVYVDEKAIRFLAQPNRIYGVYYAADRPTSFNVPESADLYSANDAYRIAETPTNKNPQYVVADTDADGIPNEQDNCPEVSNPTQEDIDGNRTGDACDDFDRDSVITTQDNCPDKPNRQQLDTDADGIGDACDPKDNRFTEQHAWIPWVGIGVAALVLVTLFGLTLRSMRQKR